MAAARRFLAWGMVDAAQPSDRRPWRPVSTIDIKKEVSSIDFRTLISHSRRLYLNLGPARGAICDKAVYSVGRAWFPRYKGVNEAWGAQATEWLATQWYGSCDIAGGMQDFQTDLLILSIAIDRDGDAGILLTEGANGWPMIQMIPAHRIWNTPDAVAPPGFYWDKGILFSPNNAPTSYRILKGQDPEDYVDVPAQDFIHLYDPDWFDQGRGFPLFIHAILDLLDYQTLQGNEKLASLISSTIALIETNENGGPDNSTLGGVLKEGEIAKTGVTSEMLDGGTIRYLKAGAGAKLEAWQSNRPSQATMDLLDRMLRNSFAGIGWPIELSWPSKDVRGAMIRSIHSRAGRTVEDRQDLLRKPAKRIVGYAIAKAIKKGILPPCADWWKWDFSMPPHISVDAGYDAEADRQDFVLGFKNLSDILPKYGKDDIKAHLRERAQEIKWANEIASEFGIEGGGDRLIARSLAGSAPAPSGSDNSSGSVAPTKNA